MDNKQQSFRDEKMRESKGKREKTQMDSRFSEGYSVWQKCSSHYVSERSFVCSGGVCPFCLHERLSSLCPDCAHDLPCSCTPHASVSVIEGRVSLAGVGSVGPISNLIESEPAFRRSKSMAVPFLWSTKQEPNSETGSDRGRSLWRLLRGNRRETKTVKKKPAVSNTGEQLSSPTSVTSKGNSWYFPSPIKVFRESRFSKMMFQQRSPLYRG